MMNRLEYLDKHVDNSKLDPEFITRKKHLDFLGAFGVKADESLGSYQHYGDKASDFGHHYIDPVKHLGYGAMGVGAAGLAYHLYKKLKAKKDSEKKAESAYDPTHDTEMIDTSPSDPLPSPNDNLARYTGLAGAGVGALKYLWDSPNHKKDSTSNKLKRFLTNTAVGGGIGYLGTKGVRAAAGHVATNLINPYGYQLTDDVDRVKTDPMGAIKSLLTNKPQWLEDKQIDKTVADGYGDDNDAAGLKDIYNKRLPLYDAFFDRPMTRGYVNMYTPNANNHKLLEVNQSNEHGSEVLDNLKTIGSQLSKQLGPNLHNDAALAKIKRPDTEPFGGFDPKFVGNRMIVSDPWNFDVKSYLPQEQMFPRAITHNTNSALINPVSLLRRAATLIGRPPTIQADVPIN